MTIELWSDPNGNGEPSDGAQLGSTVTDSNGDYLLSGLPPGDYVVVERDPPAATSTNDRDGDDDNSFNQIEVPLGEGENSISNDFLDAGVFAKTERL